MPAPLACPACERRLRQVDYQGTQVDVCDCGGIWFDAGELARWARTCKVTRPLPDGTNCTPSGAMPRPCPRCRVPSLRMRQLGDVRFGRCAKCQGIWLTPEGAATTRSDAADGSWDWADVCGVFLESLVHGFWP